MEENNKENLQPQGEEQPQNKGAKKGKQEMSLRYVLKEWVIPLTIEIVAVFLFVKFVAFLVIVPTGSMIPTIEERSVLVATRTYSPEKSISRGDIAAFESDELGKTLIKRCVGLPGDVIVLDENGNMTINGEPYDEWYVINTDDRSGRWEVPEGHYLFFGDNRSGSVDARVWDQPYISGEEIIGEARFTLFPFSNFGILK